MADQISVLVDAHRSQLEHMGLPQPLHRRLFEKITAQTFDGGEAFTFVYYGDDVPPRERYGVEALRDMPAESDVFLVDHAWRFETVAQAREMLTAHPPLLQRMFGLTGLEAGDVTDGGEEGAVVDAVVDQLMYVAFTLKVQVAGGGEQDGEGEQVIHYVNDELGTRFRFEREAPSFATAPLMYLGDGSTLSVFWPRVDVAAGDACTRAPAKRLQHLDHRDRRAYWATRFEAETEFDWYASYALLRDSIRGAVVDPAAAGVLVIGCGTSSLSADLAADGFADVHSTDFAPNCIEQMRARHPELRWSVADATDMGELVAPASVDLVLDKGCVDSMLATTDRERPWAAVADCEAAQAMMREAARVLRPGGRFLLVTVALPESRAALGAYGEWEPEPEVRRLEPPADAKAYERRTVTVMTFVRAALADVESVSVESGASVDAVGEAEGAVEPPAPPASS